MSRLLSFEERWARAVFETVFPTNACAALPEGIAGCDIEGYVTDLRASISWETALGLRFAIWMVALAPIWVLGRLATLSSLDATDRERVLRALLASPRYLVRQLVVFLKATGALLYTTAPNVRARLLPASDALREPELVRLAPRKVTHESVV